MLAKIFLGLGRAYSLTKMWTARAALLSCCALVQHGGALGDAPSAPSHAPRPRHRTSSRLLQAFREPPDALTPNRSPPAANKTRPMLSMATLKKYGVAGTLAYILTEVVFWAIAFPAAAAALHKTTGHWPDMSSNKDHAAVLGFIIAGANIARLALPLRLGAAFAVAPWVDRNVIQRFAQSFNKTCAVPLTVPLHSPPPPSGSASRHLELELREPADQAAPPHHLEALWHDDFSRRIGCWWLGLPAITQSSLTDCLGALSLHLGSRLAPELGRPTIASGAELGCEWVADDTDVLHLPQLPARLEELRLSLPPIPRLLPAERVLGLTREGSAAERVVAEVAEVVGAETAQAALVETNEVGRESAGRQSAGRQSSVRVSAFGAQVVGTPGPAIRLGIHRGDSRSRARAVFIASGLGVCLGASCGLGVAALVLSRRCKIRRIIR